MITINTKPGKQYLNQLKKRYKKAAKTQKKIILDEFTQTTGYHRKHAIDLLTEKYKPNLKKNIHRPHKIYTKEDADILEQICDLLGWISSKRMKPTIRLALDGLIKAGKVTISKEGYKRLVKISPATIDRLLGKYHKRPKIRGRSYTKPGTLLKTQIPIRTFSEWSENKVGFLKLIFAGMTED